ncbi:MAG: hypothetical protein Kow0063_30550 [Anaerolineae bacterium]
MNELLERIIKLEQANYAAMLPVAQVTPGLEVVIRDDVILTSSQIFPTPDTTHACLLRTSSQAADALIDEVRQYFDSRGLPATVYLSPACTPITMAETLSNHGFVRQEAEEAWLVLEDLPDFDLPPTPPGTCVRQIGQDQTELFASTFLSAFELPVDYAPYLAQLLAPCLDLPGVHHYLSFTGEQVTGTCSLLCHENIGILGSVGVIPAFRQRGIATNLAVRAAVDARTNGADTLMLQTTAGTPLERLLRISGFKKAFTRTCYTLP